MRTLDFRYILPIPNGRQAAFKAKAIYMGWDAPARAFQLLTDLIQIDYISDSDQSNLIWWLLEDGMRGLEEVLRRVRLDPLSTDVCEYQSKNYRIAATPNSSDGWLYIIAYNLEEIER